MIYMKCDYCGRDTKHKYSGSQKFPRCTIELYNCVECGSTHSVNGNTDVSLSASSGDWTAHKGDAYTPLSKAQAVDLIMDDGLWNDGRRIVTGPKKRWLFR